MPQLLDDRAQPVVPAVTAARLEAQLAERQVDLVVHDDQLLGRDALELDRL